jgi:hypothetical protein
MMQDHITLSEQGILQKLENFVRIALTKLKNIWRSESPPTGIQFYVEPDD